MGKQKYFLVIYFCLLRMNRTTRKVLRLHLKAISLICQTKMNCYLLPEHPPWVGGPLGTLFWRPLEQVESPDRPSEAGKIHLRKKPQTKRWCQSRSLIDLRKNQSHHLLHQSILIAVTKWMLQTKMKLTMKIKILWMRHRLSRDRAKVP